MWAFSGFKLTQPHRQVNCVVSQTNAYLTEGEA